MSKEIKIMLLVLVVVVVGIAAIAIWGKGGGLAAPSVTPVPNSVLVPAGANMTGNPNAKVTLVEFGDYQCPACAASEPIITKILSEYKSNPNFNFVFRNFPLPQHQNAQISAEAAEAAGAQGKYWEMYQLLYSHQNDWAENNNALSVFLGYAQQLKLNVDQFKNDITSNKYQNKINSDEQVGVSLGINATPTFYLNGQQAVGVPDYNGLKAQIDSLLK